MNNSPAFPTNQYANGISPSGFDTGMTLRDYFAAKAMQSFLTGDYDLYPHEAAQKAYELAEAMLKARDE
jgi:hypothetical protein